MNIEDLTIAMVFSKIRLNAWDDKLVLSFYDQISRGSGFTEKQSALILKILGRHSAALSAAMNKDISSYLVNPVFRLPVRKISSAKKLSVVQNSQYTKAIKAVFPYNEGIVESIRSSRDTLGAAFWDKDEKCWIFSLNEQSIQFLMNLSEKENFEFDDEFQTYADQIKNVHSNMEKFVPMLVVEDKKPKLINCSENIPNLSTDDLLTSIFEARKRGVLHWDETISNFIDSDEVDQLTRELLKSDPGEKFQVNSEKYDLSSLTDVVNFLGPVLVIVPGGSEFPKLTAAYEFFKEIGIENNEMSVMFRLPSETDEKFNNFVKSNELNSPISDKSRIIFISSKLPKPVLKSGIKFHSVINLGFANVHYTIKDFVEKHENLITYSASSTKGDLRFGFM